MPLYNLPVTFPLNAPNGTVSAPSYGFTNGTNGAGFYLVGATTLGYTVNGTRQFALDSTSGIVFDQGFSFSTDALYDIGAASTSRPRDLYLSGLIQAGNNGTAASPTFHVKGVTGGSGMYGVGATTLGISLAGVRQVAFDTGSGIVVDQQIIFTTDNAKDIGSAGANRPRDLFMARDVYTNNATFFLRTKATLTNGAAASTGTLTNAPAAGNPTKWIAIDDNGTTRQIPAW